MNKHITGKVLCCTESFCIGQNENNQNVFFAYKSFTELCVYPYLDLTGSDQIVDVIESFLHCFTYRHQPMVSQDEHLGQKAKLKLGKNHAQTTIVVLI